MAHDPLSPSEALRTPAGAVLGAVSFLLLAYSLLIVAQILLGVIAAGTLTVGLYLTYRTITVLDSVADAAQRVADVKEREVEAAESTEAEPHSRTDPDGDREGGSRAPAEFAKRDR